MAISVFKLFPFAFPSKTGQKSHGKNLGCFCSSPADWLFAVYRAVRANTRAGTYSRARQENIWLEVMMYEPSAPLRVYVSSSWQSYGYWDYLPVITVTGV